VYLTTWAEVQDGKYVHKAYQKNAKKAGMIRKFMKSMNCGEKSNEKITIKLGRLDFRYNIEMDKILWTMPNLPALLEP